MAELQQHVPTGKSPSYRTLTICSRDLVNGAYQLPSPILCRGVKLQSLIVANSWRTVDSSNNTFSIGATETGSGWHGDWIGTFSIRQGNYSISTLVAEMTYQMNRSDAVWTVQSSSTGTPPSKPSGTWTVTVGVGGMTQDPRVFISPNNGNVQTFFIVEQSTSATLLGFTKTRAPYYTYTADQLPQLNRVTVLNVNSLELGSRLYDHIHSSFPMQSSVIWSVPVQGSFGNYFEYHTQNPSVEFWDDRGQAPEELSRLDFSVCDDQNCPIQFQGTPWYIKLQILI